MLDIKYKKYHRLKYDHSTIGVRFIQDSLLKQNQGLLEYFVGDSAIFLFTTRPDSFKVLEVKKDFSMKGYVDKMREGIYGTYTGSMGRMRLKEATNQYIDASCFLYETLFSPIRKFFGDSTELIIIPDGELGYVPFDALLEETPLDLNDFPGFSYLLKIHPISYCYSATLLFEMQRKQHKESLPSKDFLGVAPEFPKNRLGTPHVAQFSPLQYNVEEVQAINEFIEGDLLLKKKATEEEFIDIAEYYRILHLSTHGVAHNKVGDYSYIAFSEIPNSKEDELLYSRELYGLRLNADMVVLSACETGIGELQRGEGIISLARGFSYAGAKSIITTLWKVREEPTKSLLVSFYHYLKEKRMSKNLALREAKLGLI